MSSLRCFSLALVGVFLLAGPCGAQMENGIVAKLKPQPKEPKLPDPPLPVPSEKEPSKAEKTESAVGDEEGKKEGGGKEKEESGEGPDFWHGFAASISVIIVSELGDKTWFIAAIMAMRHARSTVFLGAMAALAIMTALSAGLGWATQIIPRWLTYYVSTALFALFGLKMLKEGYDMPPNSGQEEYEEAQAEIKKKEEEAEGPRDVEAGGASPSAASSRILSRVLVESFTLTFLAEWGDRSQLTTIILAARESVAGVTLGGILGHCICTGIAVLGGRMVAQRISVRTVTLIGGVVFILFALSALVLSPPP